MIEAIVILAMEVCAPSPDHHACTAWFSQCMYDELKGKELTYQTFDNAEENCRENMPIEYWEMFL